MLTKITIYIYIDIYIYIYMCVCIRIDEEKKYFQKNKINEVSRNIGNFKLYMGAFGRRQNFS